jgi:hypothetical protein
VSVAYYLTLSDAQNELNLLDRFYESDSDPQTIYARVNSTIDTQFAIEACVLDAANTGGLPPGISPCNFDVCDPDTNGSEQINLNKLRCTYNGYAFPTPTFCASVESDVQTTYYLTQNDADNETNAIINGIFVVSGNHTIYRKIKNTNTNEFLIDDLISISLVNCSLDTDSDGIPDLVEDANKNLIYTDDNTDQDNLKNYEDNDDDGDGILTVNEDYNNNGDPTDDDTNGNGVPDYLEANVTLHINKFKSGGIKLFPNPTNDNILVELKEGIDSYTIYNLSGSVVYKKSLTQKSNNIEISLKFIKQGTYFLELRNQSSVFHEIVIKE